MNAATLLIAIIMIAGLIGIYALVIAPVWIIVRRTGFHGAWSLLMIIPGAAWILAASRWPNLPDNTKTSYPKILVGIFATFFASVAASAIAMLVEKKLTQLEARTDRPSTTVANEQVQPPQIQNKRRSTFTFTEAVTPNYREYKYTWDDADKWAGDDSYRSASIEAQRQRLQQVEPTLFSSADRSRQTINAIDSWMTLASRDDGFSTNEPYYYSISRLIVNYKNGFGICHYSRGTGPLEMVCYQQLR